MGANGARLHLELQANTELLALWRLAWREDVKGPIQEKNRYTRLEVAEDVVQLDFGRLGRVVGVGRCQSVREFCLGVFDEGLKLAGHAHCRRQQVADEYIAAGIGAVL